MKTFKEHARQDEQMRKVAQAASKLNVVKKAKDLLSKTKAAVEVADPAAEIAAPAAAACV